MIFATSAILALLPFAIAQTSTSCNPTEKQCPSDPGFPANTVFNFQESGPGNAWTVLGNPEMISQDSSGLKFTINATGQAPTLASKDYIFFGSITATLEAATGAGIVSAFILQSDDLDEIDWEWLGGDTADVQSNYFSKGNTSSYDRGATHAVSNPQTTLHTYTINWTEQQIDWIIDGTVVRTLTAASAAGQYPQTPCQIRIGTWCGGCSGEPEGTVQWAGGPTTFAGIPYIMTIQSLTVVNANPAGSYTYGDLSGSAGSIVLDGSPSNSSISVSSAGSSSASASDPASKSSTAASGSQTASAHASASASGTASSVATPVNAASETAATINTGPTGTTLASNSRATKLSVGGVIALVFGAVVLLA